MKKIIYLILIICSTSNLYCQNLTLDELISLRKKDLAEIEEFVTNKNWTFLSSNEMTDDKMGKAIFTFNKNNYDDSAECFLTYLYSDIRTRLDLQFTNKDQYNRYINRLKILGSKLILSKVKDNAIIKTYQISKTTIQITISSKNDNNLSKTKYNIFITSNEDYSENFLED